MSKSQSAIHNNEKLWPTFKHRLSAEMLQSRPDFYLTAANRFDSWLSSEKAYYSSARPHIVDILEIASDAISRIFPQTLVNGAFDPSRCPPTQRYQFDATIKVIRTAGNFYRLFVEDEIRLRLRVLLIRSGIDSKILPKSVISERFSDSPAPIPRPGSSSSLASASATPTGLFTPIPSSQNQSAPPTRRTSVPVSAFPAPVGGSSQPAIQASASRPSISIPYPPASAPLPISAQPSQVWPTAGANGAAVTSNSPSQAAPAPSFPSSIVPPPALPLTPSTQNSPPSVSQPVRKPSTALPATTMQASPAKKVKAKAKEPIESFLKADLDWFRKQKNSQSSSPVVPSATPNLPTSPALPSISTSTPGTVTLSIAAPTSPPPIPSTISTPTLPSAPPPAIPSVTPSAPLISAISIPPSQAAQLSVTSAPNPRSFEDSQKLHVGQPSDPSVTPGPGFPAITSPSPFASQARVVSPVTHLSPALSTSTPTVAAVSSGGPPSPSPSKPSHPPSQATNGPSTLSMSLVDVPEAPRKSSPSMPTNNPQLDLYAQEVSESRQQFMQTDESSVLLDGVSGTVEEATMPSNSDDRGGGEAMDVEPVQADKATNEAQNGDAIDVDETPQGKASLASPEQVLDIVHESSNVTRAEESMNDNVPSGSICDSAVISKTPGPTTSNAGNVMPSGEARSASSESAGPQIPQNLPAPILDTAQADAAMSPDSAPAVERLSKESSSDVPMDIDPSISALCLLLEKAQHRDIQTLTSTSPAAHPPSPFIADNPNHEVTQGPIFASSTTHVDPSLGSASPPRSVAPPAFAADSAPRPLTILSSSQKPTSGSSSRTTVSASPPNSPVETMGEEPQRPLRIGPPKKKKPSTKGKSAEPLPTAPVTDNANKATIRLGPKVSLIIRRPSQESSTRPELATSFKLKGKGRKRSRSPSAHGAHGRNERKRDTAGGASPSSGENMEDVHLTLTNGGASAGKGDSASDSSCTVNGIDQPMEEDTPVETPQDEVEDSWPVLGRETCIVAVERGRPGPTMFTLKVPLQPSHWELVKMWKMAGTSKKEVTKAMCLSLACYRFDELNTFRLENPGITKEKLYGEVKPVSLMHHPFTINVLSSSMHGLTFTFPPTFMKRNHNLLDLSAFVREGANDMTFTQRAGLADYVFVVLAHHPTPRQLELVEAQRSREAEWRAALDSVAAPIEPLLPPWMEIVSQQWPLTEPVCVSKRPENLIRPLEVQSIH